MINNIPDKNRANGNKVVAKKQNEEEDDLKDNVRELANKYLHYLPLFLVTISLSFATLYFYLKYKNPVFRSSINILIKDDDKKSGTSDLSKQILSGMISSGKSNLANELELIKSYSLMEKVVNKLDLNTVYSCIGRIGKITDDEIYQNPIGKFIHFSNVKDSNKIYQAKIKVINNKIFYLQKGGMIEVPNHVSLSTPEFTIMVNVNNFSLFDPKYEYKAVWYSPLAMAKVLVAGLSVEPLNKDVSIMKISMQSELPAKSMSVLNSLSEEYNNASIDEKNRMADNTIKFIDERLILISGELGGVENNLQNFRQTNNVIDEASQGKYMLDRLKDVQSTMGQLYVQMQVADMIGDYVNNPSRKYSLAPSSLGIQDAALLSLVRQYNEQVLNRETLLKTLPAGNIAVLGVEGQIQQLQANIIETTNNLKKSYKTAYNKTENDNSEILQNLNTIPRKEKQLLEISRQQGIKEKLYIYLLEKREESSITRASAVSSSMPIDPAITEGGIVSPKKFTLLIIALAVGLGVPLVFIHIKDLLSNKIITRAEIQHYTNAPIIGEISHNVNKSRVIVADKSRGLISEQFRIVRANMQYFLPNATKYSILITSTMPREGKTFICMNTGAVLAASGKKVVLLEFDMRKPKISEALNIEHNGKGLSTYLSGNATLDDIIQPIPGVENYFFAPTGPIPPNPAELLLNPQLEKLFTELNERFDHIIIDSPPTGIVSDAKVLAKYSNMNFYIVRQRYTEKKQMKFVDELYESQIFKNMAILVNDMVLNGVDGYYGYNGALGYGNGYNYDYSYGYGYGPEYEKKGIKKWLSKNQD